MKKISFVLAAAGLMSLAACNKTPEQQNVIDAGDNAAAVLDNAADNMEALADNTTNATVENLAENAADNLHAAADNATDAAHAKADNMAH